MLAPLPPNEEARLSELSCCGVLDTPPEPTFDRITRIAAQIFHVPVALIVLVDRDRQWFKSHFGIDFTETERGHSFCAYTILDPDTMIIPDAHRDPRFAECPLVVGPPFVRAYAGAPLTTAAGHQLGTLCVLDTEPRQFDPEDIRMLEELAALVVDEFELRIQSAFGQRELESRKHADRSMRAARDELKLLVQERTTALADAETRYRSLFENAVNGIYQALPDESGFLDVNPALADLLGYPTPQAVIDAVKDTGTLYVKPGRRSEFRAKLDADGVVTSMESEIFRSDGSRLWVLENARAIRDAQGVPMRYEGSVMDITARIAAREALSRAHEELEDRVHERTAAFALFNGTLLQQIADRERAEENTRRSESKFRALIENAQDLTGIITPEGVLLYASPSIEHILGYLPDDLTGRDLFEHVIHADDRETLRAQFARIVESSARYVRSEARFRHRNGSWRLLESIASCAPQDFPIVSLILNARDITERRRGEQERETQVRQQTAMAELGRFALNGPDLPVIFDKAARLIAHALEVSFSVVTELAPGGERLLIRAGSGWGQSVVGKTLVNWRPLMPDGTWHSQEPLVIRDMRGLPQYLTLSEAVRREGPVSALSVVVHSGGKPFGTLSAISSVPREFSPQDITFLQTAADLLSTLIDGKRQEAVSREAEARYQNIVANIPGVVFRFGMRPEGTAFLPFISEGCQQVYGHDAAALRANPLLLIEAVHPDDRAAHDATVALSAETLRPIEWEGSIRVPSGEIRWIAARSRPERQPNGDVVWDGIVLDVSELKRAEETMRAAKEEAEKANRAKSELLSRMSHELRTPLNAILGFGQLLNLEPLAPAQASGVEQILKSGRHLLDLINEVLDISRLDSGRMELTLERVDVASALAQAAQATRPLAAQHHVEFFVAPCLAEPLAVTADRERLNQVLLNLFSNAVKYNREGGEVRYACELRPDGQTVRLSVMDTGPGLATEQVARLFTPFQRLGAPERGIPGTGIGLTIARSLVEAMGGSIGVMSAPGEGSTFFVDLPLSLEDVSLAPPAPGTFSQALPKARTILHIDDQAANQALVERVLEARADMRLLAARDARTGLALARDEAPDLILLDLHLPDLNGEEVVRRLHHEPRTRNIPIIMLSADVMPGQLARLRQFGVRESIVKPFKIQTLLQAVDTLLSPPPHAAA